MLPERLSNELCSLRPDEDSLVMSVFMEVDPTGEVGRCEFYNSIIHSHFRLNYEEAQSITTVGEAIDYIDTNMGA